MTKEITTHEELLKLDGKKISCKYRDFFISEATVLIKNKEKLQKIYLFFNDNIIGDEYKQYLSDPLLISSMLYKYESNDNRYITEIVLLEETIEDNKQTNIETTLENRLSKYGTFTDNANITQNLCNVLKEAPNYNKLTKQHIEAFHMIFHKIARCVCGDVNYIDNIHDVVGYAKRLEEILIKKEENKNAKQN